MWLTDLIQEIVQGLLIECTLHNIVIFTVITSSSVLSVFGALRHVYTFAQKIQATKQRPFPNTLVRKRKIKASPSMQKNGVKRNERKLFIGSRNEKNDFIKDSMLYQKALHKVRENIECLKCLNCACQEPVKRCVHSLCKTCCEKNGWCWREQRKNPPPVPVPPLKPNCIKQPHCVQLSHKFLHEVPHRLGFHCMTATCINLSHNVITHLPEHMALIRRLQKIDLSHNSLQVIPHFFSSFHQLSTLDLRFNGLSTFPEILVELRSLQKLYLDNNELGLVPNSICHMHRLSHLGLGYNSICNIPPSLFRFCGLRVLRLCGNPGLTCLPMEIGHAIGIEVLDVATCSLESLPATVGHCAMLKHLIVSNNKLTHIPCEISQCCHLVTLNVSQNPLVCLPGTLHYRSPGLSLTALCSSFLANPGIQAWYFQDKLPSFQQKRNAVSLFHLARVSIKQNELNISPLPFLLKEEMSSYSSCFYCGCRSTAHCLRVIRFSTFGGETGPNYPFTYTFCAKHLQMGQTEAKVAAQLDTMFYV